MPIDPQQWLQDQLVAAVAQIAPEADASKVIVSKSKPEHASDYQSAVAMQLSKQLRRPPPAIAAELVAALAARGVSADAGGPGFLGFTLDDALLGAVIRDRLVDPHLGIPQLGDGHVVIDFSAPNVAKRMHIGHIRSTILGDALCRMGRALGWQVVGDNHIGDWGTQFGQILWAWKHDRDDGAFAADPIGELERLYVGFNARWKPKAGQEPEGFDADEAARVNDEARAELARLQAGDPENLALWRMFIDTSRHAFDEVYARLGVRFDETLGESAYNERLQPLVDELLERGVAERSDGAVCVFFRDDDGQDRLPPYLIRKSDGAALYATSDLATVEYRVRRWAPRRIVYVTDMRQRLHFEQLFEVSRRIGVDARLDHVWFGMMTLPTGKFSTRDGNVVRLDVLLDEAEARATAMLRERGLQSLGDDALADLARVIGLGAVKYADLSNNPQTNVVFSFEKMLAFEGNTAPYLQYTSARTHSLLRKAADAGFTPDGVTWAAGDPLDRDLLLHLADFGAAVAGGFDQGKPNVLATWLFELAGRYHRWYAACPVLQAPEPAVRDARLNLSLLTRQCLTRGLDLLGIEAPERM